MEQHKRCGGGSAIHARFPHMGGMGGGMGQPAARIGSPMRRWRAWPCPSNSRSPQRSQRVGGGTLGPMRGASLASKGEFYGVIARATTTVATTTIAEDTQTVRS